MPDLLGCGNTIQIRHAEVQDQDVWLCPLQQADRLVTPGGFTDQLHRWFRLNQCAQAGAHYGVIICNQHLDHGKGTWALTVVPVPRELSIAKLPPNISTRSRIPNKPSCSSVVAAAGTKPTPSSSTMALIWPSRKLSNTSTRVACAMAR